VTLTPVESSHIAAIGYLEAERVLLVRYKDGALWAWGGVQPPNWESLQIAASKGRWMATWARVTAMPGIMISKGVMPTERPNDADPVSVAEPGGNAAPSPGPLNEQRAHMQDAERVPGPLNVMDEDADACCRKAFGHISNNSVPYQGDVFVCPDCGQRFRAHTVGPSRLWRCVPEFAFIPAFGSWGRR
jgi:hypothetical protein